MRNITDPTQSSKLLAIFEFSWFVLVLMQNGKHSRCHMISLMYGEHQQWCTDGAHCFQQQQQKQHLWMAN